MGLVLTRKLQERLLIGDDVAVTLVSTGRGKCKLFIEAPREVRILRGELVERQREDGVQRSAG